MACSRIDNVNLIYTPENQLNMRICCLNNTLMGSLLDNPIEVVMAERQKLRNTFLLEHLIHHACKETCADVAYLHQQGWMRESTK